MMMTTYMTSSVQENATLAHKPYLQLYLDSWPTTRSFSSTNIHLQNAKGYTQDAVLQVIHDHTWQKASCMKLTKA